MNPEMERRIQAARDAGYSEEEIQAELAILQGTAQPPAVEPQTPIDRSEEYTGLGQGLGLEAAKLAALGYGGKKLILDPLVNMVRGPVAPPQATPPGATGRILGQVVGQPSSMPPADIARPPVSTGGSPAGTSGYAGSNPAMREMAARQAAQQSALQRGMEYTDRIRQIAMDKVLQTSQRVAPVARAMAPAAAGLGAMLYSPGLNTNEDEELRRRRMMPPTITGQ